MAPLKSFLLVSSGIASALTCSNDNCEAGDQTALLQSHLTRKSELALSSTGAAFFPKLGNLNDPSTRKSALLEIQKTAVKLASMDASEATPMVVEVCTETANMLNETVLSAIITEDHVDRAELATAYAAFAPHAAQHAEIEAAFTAALETVTQKETELRECRIEETSTCEQVLVCEEHDPCTPVEACHDCEIPDSLCQIDREIQERWCESSTEPERMADSDAGLSWRTATKTLFQRYQDAVFQCEQDAIICTNHTQVCETITTVYLGDAHECNLKYTLWEAAKCAQYANFDGGVQLYHQAFLATLTAYNNVVARVMIEEADRKVEWEVLTRVICLLLTLTNTEDGVAASADNSALIQRCWDEEVDTSHLDIDYRDPPTMLDLTPPELPCAGPFIDPIHGIDIVDIPGLKPGSACLALIAEHNSLLDRESCQCDDMVAVVAIPTFQLGDFLLIDPSVDVIGTQASESQWTAEIWGANIGGGFREPVMTQDGVVATDNQFGFPHDGTADAATTMAGSMSAPHAGALPDVTNDFFSEDEQTAGSVVAFVSWAYGTSQSFPEDEFTLEERFAKDGGFLYLNSAREVIAVRELAASSSDLNQAATSFMSFQQSKDITAAEFTDTCGAGHDVTNSLHLFLGAEKYCWTQGALSAADGGWSCATGCFVYQTRTGHVAFPRSV
jgi:hypothetical protein